MKAADSETIAKALHLLQEIADEQGPDFAIEIKAEGTSVIDDNGSFLCRDQTPETALATLRSL